MKSKQNQVYTYDALNRLETVTIDWLALSAAYEYELAGKLTGLTQFNGTCVSWGYDNANRLTRLNTYPHWQAAPLLHMRSPWTATATGPALIKKYS